jgi:hypothetical protein
MNTANQTGYWQLIYNPILVSPSFAAYNNPESCMNIDKSATGLIATVTAASISGSAWTITGAWGSGANNQYQGQYITTSGFSTSANNGTFYCTASANNSITLVNASGTTSVAGAPRAAGGIVVASGYLQQTGGGAGAVASLTIAVGAALAEVRWTNNIADTASDVYTLAVQGVSGTCTALGELQWSEDR